MASLKQEAAPPEETLRSLHTTRALNCRRRFFLVFFWVGETIMPVLAGTPGTKLFGVSRRKRAFGGFAIVDYLWYSIHCINNCKDGEGWGSRYLLSTLNTLLYACSSTVRVVSTLMGPHN